MPRAWALLGLGFLLGRVDLFGLAWPFGPAFCAAVAEFYPRLAGPVGAAASLGALSRGEVGAALAQAACCFLFTLAARRWPGTRPRGAITSLVAATALPYGALILWRHPDPYGALLLAFQLTVSGLLASAFRRGLDPAGLPAGGWQATGERILPFSLLAAGSVAGLKGLTLGPVELNAAAAALIAGAAGWAVGPGAGAMAGTVAGAVETLARTGGVPAMGVNALAGLLAGLCREWGRPGAAVGCALGVAAGWLAAGAGHGVLLGGLVGAALLIVLPAEMAEPVRAGAPDPVPRGRRLALAAAAAPAEGNARWAELARLLREVSRSCREVAATADPVLSPEKEWAGLVGRLMNEVCTGCHGHRLCWQDAFSANYRLAVSLFTEAEEGSLDAERVEGLWRGRCVRPREVALFVNQVVDLWQAERRWMRRLGESRELMAGHFQGLARIIEDLSGGQGGEAGEVRPERERAARLTYVTEVAKLARPGWMISGDSHLVRELPGMQLLVALSDGMGCGYPAASESRAAIDLVEKLLRAGFDRKTVVRMANSLMGLRSPGETFATLDLALVDLSEGMAEFIKVGAAPTFLVADDRVAVIKSRSLPLGILDTADMESSRVTLKPGQTVVMVTDGVLEGPGDLADREAWVKEVVLSRTAGKGAVGLARALLEEVSLNLSRERADDITVLVVHFLRGSGG